MTIKMERLGNLVRIRTGKLDANANDPNGIFPFFTCAENPLNINEYSYDCECVLVAGNGDLNVKYYSGKFDAYQRTYIIETINNDRLSIKYLFNFMNLYIERLRLMSIGGVIKYIKLEYLTEVKIPLPPLPEQRRIAAILDQAEALRAKRRQALAQLDELTQSVFLEMFGDPISNPKNWKQFSLKSLVDQIQIGPFGSLLHQEDYVSDGIPLINPMHIVNGKIKPDNKQSVTQKKHAELKLYQLKEGDVIMARRGEMGRCAIVASEHDGLICGTGSLFIRPNNDKMIAHYINATLSSSSMRKRLESFSLGATLPNLNSGIIESLILPLPPIALQYEYLASINSINRLKSTQRESLAQLDSLFASLEHRAFQGEL
jgi:type I restriction enzyme S subunit